MPHQEAANIVTQQQDPLNQAQFLRYLRDLANFDAPLLIPPAGITGITNSDSFTFPLKLYRSKISPTNLGDIYGFGKNVKTGGLVSRLITKKVALMGFGAMAIGIAGWIGINSYAGSESVEPVNIISNNLKNVKNITIIKDAIAFMKRAAEPTFIEEQLGLIGGNILEKEKNNLEALPQNIAIAEDQLQQLEGEIEDQLSEEELIKRVIDDTATPEERFELFTLNSFAFNFAKDESERKIAAEKEGQLEKDKELLPGEIGQEQLDFEAERDTAEKKRLEAEAEKTKRSEEIGASIKQAQEKRGKRFRQGGTPKPKIERDKPGVKGPL